MAFYGAVLGAMIRIECPKCGEVQVRARPRKNEPLRCRSCNTLLPLGPEAKASKPKR